MKINKVEKLLFCERIQRFLFDLKRFNSHFCFMSLQRLLLFIFILLPALLFAQAKDKDPSVLDSMVNELPKIPDSKNSKGVLLGNIGMGYSEQNNYSTAIEYYNKALKVFNDLGNENGVARVSGNIGSIYLSLALDSTGGEKSLQEADSNLHKAIDYLNRSISLSRENGYPDIINTFYKDLAEAISVQSYNDAVAARQNNTGKKQAIDDEGNVKIANIGTRKDEEIKSKQSADRDKERWYYIAGITTAVLVLLVVLIIVFISMFRTYTRQKANTKIISE